MLFNSIEYFIFLPIVLGLYWTAPHLIQNRLLLIASYLFYGLWDIRFLFLITLSTSADYLIGLLIQHGKLSTKQILKASTWLILSALVFLSISWPNNLSDFTSIKDISTNAFGLQLLTLVTLVWPIFIYILLHFSRNKSIDNRRLFLTLSITINLTILGFFKYFNFFIGSAESALSNMGMANIDLFHLNIILPVGISFYTFQTISYSFDIYRKQVKPTQNFLDFALFVAYFPQLVAGPIERASALLPRLLAPRRVSIEQIKRGLTLILWGLFKKIAIADGVAGSVNSIYNTSGHVSSLDIILATFLFAIQIYCDFSAYSDIARGTSKLMGIELMRNFNLPYFSQNPSEFWRRWHISLSSWLRDYLYIPLGGNRDSEYKTYRNLSITMLLGGLWHGAAWNYILWGGYQGIALSIHRYFSKKGSGTLAFSWKKTINIFFFFIITCYGWLLFRANSLEQIANFSYTLFIQANDWSLNMKRPTFAAILALPLLIIYEWYEYKSGTIRFYQNLPKPVIGMAIAVITWLIAMGLSNEPSQFIYFQF
jgi:D-alanyl-lipoteichoic acid acyltransferase DltB (MBOAT superfamily)